MQKQFHADFFPSQLFFIFQIHESKDRRKVVNLDCFKPVGKNYKTTMHHANIMKKITSQKANNMKIHFNPLITLGIALIILTHFSCQKDKLEGDIINDSRLIENLYTNSSDTLIIDTQKLILETYLYRDFTPGVLFHERNNRLFATIYLVNIDSTLITQNFIVKKLYVINNNQAWSSKPESRPENYVPEHKAHFISKNGPEWETGIRVDVVLSVTDLTNNKEKFLIARNQIIDKVE